MVVTSAQVRSLCSVTLFGAGWGKDQTEKGNYEDEDGMRLGLMGGTTTINPTTMGLDLGIGGSSGWNWRDPG